MGTIQLNLTSMLDVVFNILAFFVVTFSPPIPERNYDVHLPPPKLEEKAAPTEGELPTDEPKLFESVQITLIAGPGGSLAGIQLEQKPVPVLGPGGTSALARELRVTAGALAGMGEDRLEAATIIASPGLKYRYLIAAVDACYQANVRKIHFAEPAGPPAPK